MNNLMRSLVLLLALCAPAAAQMGGMGGHAPPVPMTPDAFAAAPVGANVQISVRVESRKRSTIEGELLKHESDTLAAASGQHVTLYFPQGTPVIMGTAADVQRGAVCFVYGVVTKRGHVDVKRLVVDTKYVHVQ